MIKLKHYDDGKGKWQSHEISIAEDQFANFDLGIYSHDFSDIIGFGETKEEALDDFIRKFEYLLDEWKVFASLLLESNVVTDNIIEEK